MLPDSKFHSWVVILSILSFVSLPGYSFEIGKKGTECKLSKKTFDPEADTIAIVGAGVSGLAAARTFLKKVKPEHITIIEKESQAGGKVSSWKAPNTNDLKGYRYDMGAMVMVTDFYHNINKLIEKYGYKDSMVSLDKGGFIDILQNEIVPVIDTNNKEDVKDYFLEIQLIQHLFDGTGPFADKGGAWEDRKKVDSFLRIPKPIQNVTWPEFVQKYDLDKINRAFATLLNGSGSFYIGSKLMNPHAAHVLKHIDQEYANGISGSLKNFGPRSFNGLLVDEAKDLKKSGINFSYDTEVVGIRRGEDDVTLKVKQGGQLKNLHYDHVLYTANLKKLPAKYHCSQKEERQAYNMINYIGYRSYLAKITGLENGAQSHGIYPYVVKEQPGQPISIYKQHKDTDVYVIYTFIGDWLPDSTVENNIRVALEGFTGLGTKVKVEKFYHKTHWNYYPHLNENLEEFMKLAWGAQGLGGVWTTGEVYNFPNVEFAYVSGKEVAEKILDSNNVK